MTGDYNFLKKNIEFNNCDKFIDLSLYSHNALIYFFNMIYYGKVYYFPLTNKEKIQCIDLNNQYECNGQKFDDPKIDCKITMMIVLTYHNIIVKVTRK